MNPEAPLIITMGDPTGVGPELIIKAWLSGALDEGRSLVVAGDIGVLRRACRLFDLAAEQSPGAGELVTLQAAGRQLQVRPLSVLPAEELNYGQPDRACGEAMVAYIEWALEACRDGRAAGMVTAPINTAAINAAGIAFPGHTELLAARCGVEKVVMMLAGERLKVCLVTTHLAYQEVPRALTLAEILATIRITDQAFRLQFGRPRPKLAVLALNPHAGEGGLFGDEEARVIGPAIRQAQAEGIAADGPHSADTLFHFAARGQYDAVICMYHDQGLIPLKLLHFEDAVNVTLGLPIVRTSVDHGTAYDIAGTGQGNIASLVAAIDLAEQMSSA